MDRLGIMSVDSKPHRFGLSVVSRQETVEDHREYQIIPEESREIYRLIPQVETTV